MNASTAAILDVCMMCSVHAPLVVTDRAIQGKASEILFRTGVLSVDSV